MKTAHRMSARAKRLRATPTVERAFSILNVLDQNNPLRADEIKALDTALCACLSSITEGRGTREDAAVVLAACESCIQLEANGLESGHGDDLRTAKAEIEQAMARMDSGKSLLLTGTGIGAAQTMVDVHLAFLTQCTRSMWIRVLNECSARAAGPLTLSKTASQF